MGTHRAIFRLRESQLELDPHVIVTSSLALRDPDLHISPTETAGNKLFGVVRLRCAPQIGADARARSGLQVES